VRALGHAVDEPADALRLHRVEGRHVGLDVEHRRSVEEIHAGDLQRRAGDGKEPDDREPDRVGMTR
jgi:hypothetical protein